MSSRDRDDTFVRDMDRRLAELEKGSRETKGLVSGRGGVVLSGKELVVDRSVHVSSIMRRLDDLESGLSSHGTQYLRLAGRTGGQTVAGPTTLSGAATLASTVTLSALTASRLLCTNGSSQVSDDPSSLAVQLARLGLGAAADSNTVLKVIPTAVSNEGRCYWQGNGQIGMRMGFDDSETNDRAHFQTVNAATYNPSTGAMTHDDSNRQSLMQYWMVGTSDPATYIRWSKSAYGGTTWSTIMQLGSSGDLHVYGGVRSDSAFNHNGTDGISSTLTLDDGANWRITMTFSGGILTAKSTAGSTAAAATWS